MEKKLEDMVFKHELWRKRDMDQNLCTSSPGCVVSDDVAQPFWVLNQCQSDINPRKTNIIRFAYMWKLK